MNLIYSLAAILVFIQVGRADPLSEPSDVTALNDGLIANVRGEFPKAIRLFRFAAERNNSTAQLFLGRLYLQNQAFRDCAIGTSWLIKSADLGNSEAASTLGELYKEGDCVGKNDELSLGWYLKAASKGYPTAAYEVAKMYLSGNNGGPNYGRSFSWLIRAVKYYDKDACVQLGRMYFKGAGVSKDYQEAFK